MTDVQTSYGLESYVNDVCSLMDRDAEIPALVGEIESLNHRLIASGFVLPESLRTLHPTAPYTRNLIHQDPKNRFAIIAILWGPFQETRIHDHLNWCVVGMLEQACVATDYERIDDESDANRARIRVRDTSLLNRGDVCSLLPPPRTNIHRLSNGTGEIAVTLHTYGDPGAKARVFDPLNGRVEIVDLEFHNA